jgi:hypothetical protein
MTAISASGFPPTPDEARALAAKYLEICRRYGIDGAWRLEELAALEHDAYANLKPVLRKFVDGILAGEKQTHVMRRLRPRLMRPDVKASKWLARPDVRAAIAAQSNNIAKLAIAADRIEQHLAVLARAACPATE